MAKLQEQEGMAARTLEFTILTAARTGETIGARRSELDRREGIWTIPAARMKSGKKHRVPLSDQALEILPHEALSDEDFVFPGGRGGQPLRQQVRLRGRRRRLHQRAGKVCLRGKSRYRDLTPSRRLLTDCVAKRF